MMDSSPENTQIETYLDRLCVWLALLPSEEREEAREEMRQHIQLIADGEREHGATPADAVAAALDKMGDVDTLGERLYQARLRKEYEQVKNIETLMPPILKARYQALKFLGTAWCGMIAIAFVLPVYYPQYGNWVMRLTFGSMAGVGYGVMLGWFSALSQEPLRKATKEAGPITLPPLPNNASSRGRQHYHQQERILQRFGQRSTSGGYGLVRLMIPMQAVALLCVTVVPQSTNLVILHHFAPNELRLVAEMLVMFAAQDISTLAAYRWLKRKPAP